MVRIFGLSALLLAALLLTSGMAASAQVPPSPAASVTMTELQLRDALARFVKSLVVPAPLTDRIPRWESGICPSVVGQSPATATLITAQLRGIAKAVGAPIDEAPSCQPNIEIVFTTT